MSNPQTVKIRNKAISILKSNISLVILQPKNYEEKLMEILPSIQPYVCLIFANTRGNCKCSKRMRDEGYGVIELHGDLTPRERVKAMKDLANLEKSFVVATDIAARGIDIDGVSHVISLGFPKEIDYYIHRSGRTGRAGRDGICYALYEKKEDAMIRQLEVRGIHFDHKNFKNNTWVDLEPLHKKKVKKDDPLEKEIAKDRF